VATAFGLIILDRRCRARTILAETARSELIAEAGFIAIGPLATAREECIVLCLAPR
jgi:hypothetical protein